MAPGRSDRAWLTPGQAAALLGVRRCTVIRRLATSEWREDEVLRGIRIVGVRGSTRSLYRIDADCLLPGSPPPVPAADLDTFALADWLGVSAWTVEHLRDAGLLIGGDRIATGGRGWPRLPPTWLFPRRAVLRFLADHALNS